MKKLKVFSEPSINMVFYKYETAVLTDSTFVVKGEYDLESEWME